MGIHEQANRVRRDVYPDAAWAAVKLAIRQTIAHWGKQDAFAEELTTQTGVKWHGGRLSEWSNMTDPTEFPNLWQVAQIEALAGVDWITQAMCALHNADLVKRTAANSSSAIIERLASAAHEIGEALSASATAAAKPGCTKTAIASIREGHEAIRSLKELVAAIEAQIGEGK